MSNPLSSLVKVVHGSGDFSSKLVSLVDREPGALLTKITAWKPAITATYATVQVGKDANIELTDDLVYLNHSCNPSVIFDVEKLELRILADRPLKSGDEVTFFYPSTEWDLAQRFECTCGSEHCLRTVQGAKYLDDATLERYWLNPHIIRLLATRTNFPTQSKED